MTGTIPAASVPAGSANYIQNIKYDRLAVVLLNAVKEQQQQIKQQSEQIQSQQRQIESLKKWACRRQPQADFCKAVARRVSANRK